MVHKILSAAICGLLISEAASALDYVCASDKIIGFSLNKESHEWMHTNFKSDKKYLLHEKNKNEKC